MASACCVVLTFVSKMHFCCCFVCKIEFWDASLSVDSKISFGDKCVYGIYRAVVLANCLFEMNLCLNSMFRIRKPFYKKRALSFYNYTRLMQSRKFWIQMICCFEIENLQKVSMLLWNTPYIKFLDNLLMKVSNRWFLSTFIGTQKQNFREWSENLDNFFLCGTAAEHRRDL